MPRSFDEFRIDSWTPFSKLQLDRLAFDINDGGANTSFTGASIGYLDQSVSTFQAGKGYVIAFNASASASKPAVAVIFGNKQPCSGSPCASTGADKSAAIISAQTIVEPVNHPCAKLPAGCGWNKRTFNVMDWDYSSSDKGLAIIPTTHLTSVPVGSLYVDEMYLVMRKNGLSSEMQGTISHLSQNITAPQLITAGQATSADIEAIRTRLVAHQNYTNGVATDVLGIYPVPGIE
jgi:hypothetical protein